MCEGGQEWWPEWWPELTEGQNRVKEITFQWDYATKHQGFPVSTKVSNVDCIYHQMPFYISRPLKYLPETKYSMPLS